MVRLHYSPCPLSQKSTLHNRILNRELQMNITFKPQIRWRWLYLEVKDHFDIFPTTGHKLDLDIKRRSYSRFKFNYPTRSERIMVRPHLFWCACTLFWCACTLFWCARTLFWCARTIWREISSLRQKGEVRPHLILVRPHPSFSERKKIEPSLKKTIVLF